jgi:hypothetical protein
MFGWDQKDAYCLWQVQLRFFSCFLDKSSLSHPTDIYMTVTLMSFFIIVGLLIYRKFECYSTKSHKLSGKMLNNKKLITRNSFFLSNNWSKLALFQNLQILMWDKIKMLNTDMDKITEISLLAERVFTSCLVVNQLQNCLFTKLHFFQ